MAQEVRAQTAAGPIAQGLIDMAQSWSRLAAELAPQVPELPAVIQQEVAGLGGKELTEELVNASARAITRRVEAAGYPDEAALLLRRMGRAMYELLLVVATQEELRAMGLLLAAAPPLASGNGSNGAGRSTGEAAHPAVRTAPPTDPTSAPSPAVTAPSPPISKAAVPTEKPAQSPKRQEPKPTEASAGAPVAPRVPPPAGPTVVVPPSPSTRSGGAPAQRAPAEPRVAPAPTPPQVANADRPVPAANSPEPPVPTPDPTATPAVGGPELKAPELAVEAEGRSPAAGSSPPPPAAAPPSPPVESGPPPLSRPAGEAAAEEASLWGFDPSSRGEQDEAAKVEVPDPEAPEVAIAVEATPTAPKPTAPPVESPPPPAPAGASWRVRLSPRQFEARERKIEVRRAELRALGEEIVTQVHEQRRAVSERGPARQAVHMAAELGAPADLPSAEAQLASALAGGNLERAAAVVLRACEAYPGGTSAALACRAGEALREAKREDLATLALTTAVLAAPPHEQACWQLAGLALERKDPRLAPIWLEFVARLLRVRGADEDAVVVYRQLLNLCPRRSDVREVLRVASLTGSLPESPVQAAAS